ncbi:MAG TPA: ABC transporter ATP-binding protein [Clostridiales bacterium]|jgi:branched-chain amino acid transport system ATP-binding protein|nr:ABC transporter ATP-binding protein [Clostridiales bacterium]
MLKIENLNVAYGDVQVLWDVNMEVEDGKIVALVGSNAAGKSTTINTISGLMKPMSGSIIFNEHKLHEMNSWDIPKVNVIQVPEGRKLFSHMTVRENLELGSMVPEAKKKRKETMEMVFELLPDLKMKENSLAGELSGGQQQMVAIGRGLMGNPKLLMLDEMSLGLAPLLVEQTFEIVKKINATGTTILLVEQNVQQSLAIADYAYVLENGRIVMSGLGKDLLADENLKKSYLGM